MWTWVAMDADTKLICSWLVGSRDAGTAYAFMQAMGLVNDHLAGCAIRKRAEQARSAFQKPH